MLQLFKNQTFVSVVVVVVCVSSRSSSVCQQSCTCRPSLYTYIDFRLYQYNQKISKVSDYPHLWILNLTVCLPIAL